MTNKICPSCGSGRHLETDTTAGNVVCSQCGCIVEEGILVSEVGFAEGAGGRVHVQGTFVSHHSTGISGLRGKGGQPNSETVKQQGQMRIELLANDMGLGVHIKNGARRFFGLAVDNKFNRGRKTEYIIASCLYLQCRLQIDSHMLIDFSERLRINVYELGATYLKLRGILHLTNPMPEVDPAIYNLRFALRLDLGTDVNTVATDASRLVRRFKADWMTQGRRPAGVCGACMIIAARMSNYLRTPEEVAQVVKVSPGTIRRRLLEFAQTKVAAKTVAEWRTLTDKELVEGDVGEDPPVVKKARAKAEAVRIAALNKAEEDALAQAQELGEDGERIQPRKRRRKGKQAVPRGGRSTRALAIDPDGVGDVQEDDSDYDLGALEQNDFVNQIASVRDNPEEVAAEVSRESVAFRQETRRLLVQPEKDAEVLAEWVSRCDRDGKNDDGNEEGDGYISDTDLQEKVEERFYDWDNRDATIDYLGKRYFSEEERLLQLTPGQLRERVKAWLRDRNPKEVVREIAIVETARRRRDLGARATAEDDFGDLDEEELDAYFSMKEGDVRARARMWLSQNGKWLVEDKERQLRKAAYNKAHGIDPSKPKPKRKRARPRQTPYTSAREAIEGFASEKKFSTRINYEALKNLGIDTDDYQGLERFADEKEDGEGDEKYDEDDKEDEDEGEGEEDDEEPVAEWEE